MINFPINPTLGQQHTSGGRTWECSQVGPPAVWDQVPIGTSDVNAAGASALLAKDWATKTDGEVVVGQGRGAKYYSDLAASTLANKAENADLSDTAAASKGAGRIGFTFALAYAAGTLGAYVKSLVTAAGLAAASTVAIGGYSIAETQNSLDFAKTLQDYTALRAYTANRALGIRITTAGIAGDFQLDPTDTTTADNGGTVIVDAGLRRWKRMFVGDVNVQWFGALGAGADESSAVVAALAAHNRVTIPRGVTVVAKNIELQSFARVICDGALKLPNACSDFDRLLWAAGKSNISITAKELDGNYAGQAGNIGTHLVYLTNCPDAVVNVSYAHDHYVASGATMPSVDGIRNASSGAVFLYQCARADVTTDLLRGWGREGIYMYLCDYARSNTGHAQGVYVTEYSGVQMSGNACKLVRASVDNAGASGVGFDVTYGTCSNVIVTNTRANNGLNIGHPGLPGTGSTFENIVIDGCFGFGIGVAASSKDVTINNFSVSNAGNGGVSFSDGSVDGKLTGGVVRNSARYNLNASVTQVQCSNVKSTELDARTLTLNTLTGTFAEGEVVTTSTGTATVRRRVNGFGEVILFFATVTSGTFSVAQVATGGTSGATGTITRVDTPVQRNESSGGLYIDESRYFTGTTNQTRFPDGTAIASFSLSCALTAANTIEEFTRTFSSNVVWVGAPNVVVSIGSTSGSDAYTVNRLSAIATTADVKVKLNATVAPATYGVQVILTGRWK